MNDVVSTKEAPVTIKQMIPALLFGLVFSLISITVIFYVIRYVPIGGNSQAILLIKVASLVYISIVAGILLYMKLFGKSLQTDKLNQIGEKNANK